MTNKTEIKYYQDYISTDFKKYLLEKGTAVSGVPNLIEVGIGGGLESKESFGFVCEVYDTVKAELNSVLEQRVIDRKFIDERVKSYYEFNKEYDNDFLSTQYKTILGDTDADGRIVIGPKLKNYAGKSSGAPVAEIPKYLQGNHITLFGPPDDAKLSINAMNAFHRKLKGEPEIVTEILKTHDGVPKWGADDEDSKTPLRSDLISASVNLTGCLNKDIKFHDEKRNKTYALEKDKLSFPIKRFPGLALPCSFLFYHENPIPLHLYDFALHLFENWHNPEALVFYVPKLENEEEAKYIKNMIEVSEKLIQKDHPEYKLGTVRLIIVLENPRAVFRVNEMMDELYPYFAGASLGWHDYLGSTARLFKEDGNYRIPVKADPDIVIKYIKASHDLLAHVVGERGGIKIGGMYGILPITNDLDTPSFQITIKGFFRDVITQMKRDLSGFWVAHPDFVRIGMAIVEAWKFYAKGEEDKLKALISGLLHEEYSKEIWNFVKADDIKGLDLDDEFYPRSLIVADMKESTFIANNHPDEIRYNVFQSLQYLTDWLSGNGCVALPSQITDIPVRVMDDLATAERSRWEVWHELYHGRFSVEEFIKIAHEEMNFIRRDLSDDKKIVQVKYTEENAKWYPVAMKLMLKLMTDVDPVEFATELLLPFTIDEIRNSNEPWNALVNVDPNKFKIKEYVERYHYYFEMCGSSSFAKTMAKNIAIDEEAITKSIMDFNLENIIQAASFHGNIGESSKNLDAMAKAEQKKVAEEGDSIKQELLDLGQNYLDKFGVKFLISAKNKSASELLDSLNLRLNNTLEKELDNARLALKEITLKRVDAHPLNNLKKKLDKLVRESGVTGVQLSVSAGDGQIQTLCFGDSIKDKVKVSASSLFEIASLSKSYASAFSMEYFKSQGISLYSSVNELLKKYESTFLVSSSVNTDWEKELKIKHLMSHCALNMHYVNGVPANSDMPHVSKFLEGNEKYKYPKIDIINQPGKVFKYSGGGFLVLEYLIELISKKSINELAIPFFKKLDQKASSFNQKSELEPQYAYGYDSKGNGVIDGYKKFPAFAAGMMGNSSEILTFLNHLTNANLNLAGSGGISHDTAIEMLHGSDKGCQEFMGANMGRGVFILEAGDNKLALHQGANDGFRSLYLYCFEGPDMYKGLSLLCNGELDGVVVNSLISQEVLKSLNIAGIDFSKFKSNFDIKTVPSEEVVNIGYKKLIFDAFERTLPEEIIEKGRESDLSKFNLAIGAEISKVSNQKFARAENLISPNEPVFDPKLFGNQGKVMDSWESARHNPDPYDELTLKLKEASEINYLSISTKYHLGNQVQFVKLLGLRKGNLEFENFLEKTGLEGHAEIKIKLDHASIEWSDIKVQVFPDGGITRLGLYKDLPKSEIASYKKVSEAKCEIFNEQIAQTQKPMAIDTHDLGEFTPNKKSNYASLAFGAKVISATDEHYAPAYQVLSPYRPIDMFDGLESKRSRDPDHFEEVIFDLAESIDIDRVVMDFTHFVNNNPVEVRMDYETDENNEWKELISNTNVKAFAGNKKEFIITENNKAKKLRLIVTPDGGMNRISIYRK